jgi:para-aminobenzoate synthetase
VLTLLIDNYDSYTYNLFQLLAEINGEEPLVVRNDAHTWAELTEKHFDNIVLSPGPGHPGVPGDFGVCAEAIRHTQVPLLGVCLGHQGLAHTSGGTVASAPQQMHGYTSQIRHNGRELFADLPQDFAAVRYHSLCVTHVPRQLEATAWAEDGVVMALRDRRRPSFGVQFHPESICTEHGRALLRNFREAGRRVQLPTPNGHSDRSRTPPPTPSPTTAPPAAEPGPPARYAVVYRKLENFIDPEIAFHELFAGAPVSFWLDSSRAERPLSRFSFMGDASGPLSQVVAYDVARGQLSVRKAGVTQTLSKDVFTYIQEQLSAHRCDCPELPFAFCDGFVGYLGYELKALCGASSAHASNWPDAHLVFADRVVAFDHEQRAVYLVALTTPSEAPSAHRWLHATAHRLQGLSALPPATPPTAPQAPSVTFQLHRGREEYLEAIKCAQELIGQGETYEVCLTNQISTDATPDPLLLYRLLRRTNPAPYAAYLKLDDRALLSCSPERYLRIDRAGAVEAKPIKGTAPRSPHADVDRERAQALRLNEKDRAENLMIVDLLRNDLGRVCQVGSVSVPALMHVETYETVHQLVSTVTGRLRADVDAIDCVRASFPGGSMTGAPKLRTMEIIDALEGRARGVYSGTIAALGVNGTADMSIVIRTVVLDGDGARIGAGGAIVAASDPASEFDEMLLKARVLAETIALACTGRPDRFTYEHSPEQLGAAAIRDALLAAVGRADDDNVHGSPLHASSPATAT